MMEAITPHSRHSYCIDCTRGAPRATVDQTGSPEQELTEESDKATLSRELDAASEPQAAPDRLAKVLETNEPDPDGLDKSEEAPEPTPLVLAEAPPAAWPHAIVPNLSSEALASSDLAYARSVRQEALSFGVEPSPSPPARNPARGQNIETAVVPSNAAMPPMPRRNPLR